MKTPTQIAFDRLVKTNPEFFYSTVIDAMVNALGGACVRSRDDGQWSAFLTSGTAVLLGQQLGEFSLFDTPEQAIGYLRLMGWVKTCEK